MKKQLTVLLALIIGVSASVGFAGWSVSPLPGGGLLSVSRSFGEVSAPMQIAKLIADPTALQELNAKYPPPVYGGAIPPLLAQVDPDAEYADYIHQAPAEPEKKGFFKAIGSGFVTGVKSIGTGIANNKGLVATGLAIYGLDRVSENNDWLWHNSNEAGAGSATAVTDNSFNVTGDGNTFNITINEPTPIPEE